MKNTRRNSIAEIAPMNVFIKYDKYCRNPYWFIRLFYTAQQKLWILHSPFSTLTLEPPTLAFEIFY